MSQLSCPHCQKSMKTVYINNLEIDSCPSCGGIFLDFGELHQFIKKIPHKKKLNFENIYKGDHKSDHKHDYLCCKCNHKMNEKIYAYNSGIHIDTCSKCKGIFLNKKDIEDLQKYIYSRKDSEETKENAEKAQKIIKQVNSYRNKYKKDSKKEIDDLFWLDDLPGINTISEYLIGKLVD